jgi:ABC-type branched-subunit amino acid transport system substrate-binding protein
MMSRVGVRLGTLTPCAIAAVVVLIGSACGARLTKEQIAGAEGGTKVRSVAAGDVSGDGTTETTASGGTATGGGAGGGGGAPGVTSRGTGAVGSGPAAEACRPDNSGTFDPGLSATAIHFGNVSTVGGPVPGIFKGARDGANAFFQYQNALGGVCGRKLSLDFQDDGLDASQNQQAYQNLIPKVFGFVGSFSVVDEGGSQVLGQNGSVPDAAYALSQAHFNLANNFSVQPLKPKAWRLGPLQYFKDKFGPSVITKVAYFTEDAQSAKDAAEGEKMAAGRLGYQFVYERVTEPTETDFGADVNNMKSKGVQAVFMAGEAGQMARIAATMKQQSFTIPLANWGANAYDPAFVSQSQGGAEGAIIDMQNSMFYGEDAASNPEVKLFDDWVKRVGGKPDLFAAYAWASARLMVRAVQQAGPKPTRAAVLNALKGIHQFDANGLFPMADPAGKVPPTCYVIITVKGGKFVRDAVNPSGYKCDPGGYS